MEIRKLNMETLTRVQFEQIVEIERHCGLAPYSPEMLIDCIISLDTYACMDGETIAGFITIQPHSPKLGGELYIVNLNVAKFYRRQGVGAKLILTACKSYKRTHAGRLVTLDVAKVNTPAMNLYKKLGFTVTDIPSRNGENDVVMAISLAELSTYK